MEDNPEPSSAAFLWERTQRTVFWFYHSRMIFAGAMAGRGGGYSSALFVTFDRIFSVRSKRSSLDVQPVTTVI